MKKNRYLEIYEHLKNRIIKGEFVSGEKISSENELKDFFGVSRNTIRRAIYILSSEGFLSSVQGKGVFVLEKTPLNFQFGGTQSFKEVSEKNRLNYTTTVPIFEVVQIDEISAKKTGFPLGIEVYHVVRIRNIDRENVILDENFFLKDIADGLNVSISMNSIYNFLENIKNLKINGAQKFISVELASEMDKKYLDLKGNSLVALVKNFAYLDNGTLFEYTESHHRPDRFIFSSFAKRN